MKYYSMRWTILIALLWASMLTQCGTFPPAPPATTPLPQLGATATPLPTHVAIPLPHTVYAVSADNTQLVITTDNQQRTIKLPNGIQQLAIAPQHIAVRNNDNDISIIDVASKRKETLPLACDRIAWHYDADTLWCVAYAQLYQVSPSQSRLVALAPVGYRFVQAMHRPTSTDIWAILEDDTGATQFCQITPALSCHINATSAQWNADGTLVAVADMRQIEVLDATAVQAYEIPLVGVTYVGWLDTDTLFVRTNTETYVYQIRTRQLTTTTKQIPATYLLGVQ